MLGQIENGSIRTVIVKDMSRVVRDYLQVGFYTEVFFREKGVRFIAVSNGVDSTNNTSSEFAPFLNIMNEWYLRDCSRKISVVLRAKGKEGKLITSNPPYGYVKSPEDIYRRRSRKADDKPCVGYLYRRVSNIDFAFIIHSSDDYFLPVYAEIYYLRYHSRHCERMGKRYGER